MTNEEYQAAIDEINVSYNNALANFKMAKIAVIPNKAKEVLKNLQNLREMAVKAVETANVNWQKLQRLERGGTNAGN